MRVFISWSGETSEKAAKELRDWIPSVLQNVKPYFTPNDIDKGARWSSEIFKELETSSFGILALTKENLERPWILFEAGALIAKLEAKVCPLLIGVGKADLKGPLSHFQATLFQKEDFKKLMAALNKDLSANGVAPEVFEKIFEKWWPDLDNSVSKILEQAPIHATKTKTRTDREILEEVLVNIRDMQRARGDQLRAGPPPGMAVSTKKLVEIYCELSEAAPLEGDREIYIDLLIALGDRFRKVCEERMAAPNFKTLDARFRSARTNLQFAKDEPPF